MSDLPFLSCLCPTFRRPKLLESAIACWLAQDYPASRRDLVIVDDANQIEAQGGDGWRIVTCRDRFPSLPAKYNFLAALAHPEADAFVIWEDDDLYLPQHLAAHAAALADHAWSKPSQVFSLYPGRPVIERSDGRFFASLAVRKELWNEVGGVANTKAAQFDQITMSRFRTLQGLPGDCIRPEYPIPGYCFRWGSTHAYHGQGFMQGPQDETWYDADGIRNSPSPDRVHRITPRFDPDWKPLLDAASTLTELTSGSRNS